MLYEVRLAAPHSRQRTIHGYRVCAVTDGLCVAPIDHRPSGDATPFAREESATAHEIWQPKNVSPKVLDSRTMTATNELSDLQTVCLWRRFFGHSFVPCRRFARLYQLAISQAILTSRVLHPFGDPRLAFFRRVPKNPAMARPEETRRVEGFPSFPPPMV